MHHPRPFGTAERHRFGADAADEASRCIPRNIITQCVGAPAGIQPDWYAARADGRFIICSDGLHAQIGREQLAEIAAAYADPQMAADMLVHAALNAGGRDNITVIVVDMRSDMPCDEDWNVAKSAMTRISTMCWTVRCKRYEPFNKMVTDHETRRS